MINVNITLCKAVNKGDIDGYMIECESCGWQAKQSLPTMANELRSSHLAYHAERKADQKRFVTNLSQNIVKQICHLIDNDHIPLSWDGTQLRVLLENRFIQAATMDCHNKVVRAVNKVVTKIYRL